MRWSTWTPGSGPREHPRLCGADAPRVLPPCEIRCARGHQYARPARDALTRAFMLSPVADTSEPPPDSGVPLDPDAPRRRGAVEDCAPVRVSSARTILIPEWCCPSRGALGPASAVAVGGSGDRESQERQLRSARRASESPDDELNLPSCAASGALSRAGGAGRGMVPADVKGPSDFLGAAFFLSAATHAVSGRESRAIGAGRWRCSARIPARCIRHGGCAGCAQGTAGRRST